MKVIMKKSTILSFSTALLLASCSFPSAASPTGQPSPGASTATPLPHWALLFDGRDDYIVVADDPSLDLQNNFTITAWIYLKEYTEWASIVTKGDKPNINNYAVQQSGPNDPIFRTEYGRLRFSGCTGLKAPLPESATIVALETWHFVAVTFDGQRLSYYLNAKPDGTSAVTGPLCVNDAPLFIGVDFPLTTENWHGVIDELRIWNAALNESQIRDVMFGGQGSMASALVGYWSFDEGSGTVAHDLSGYGNDGTLIGNPQWVDAGAPIP
jgi:hypothetical protein